METTQCPSADKRTGMKCAGPPPSAGSGILFRDTLGKGGRVNRQEQILILYLFLDFLTQLLLTVCAALLYLLGCGEASPWVLLNVPLES